MEKLPLLALFMIWCIMDTTIHTYIYLMDFLGGGTGGLIRTKWKYIYTYIHTNIHTYIHKEKPHSFVGGRGCIV